jgi:hypothetical protein
VFKEGTEMMHKFLTVGFTTILLSYGLIIAPANAQRDASILPPEEGGRVTVAGCLALGGKDGDELVLANPRLGPIESVTDGACNAAVDDRALILDDVNDDHGFIRSMLGRWVEIDGTLEKEESDDLTNLRELEVDSFRLVPVIPPRAEAEPIPAPAPQAQAEPAAPASPEESPVGTTGFAEEPLPQTASALPMIGILGLLSLAGSLGFRWYRS